MCDILSSKAIALTTTKAKQKLSEQTCTQAHTLVNGRTCKRAF